MSLSLRTNNFWDFEGKQDVLLPFTDDFEETYQKTYGESLLDHVPENFCGSCRMERFQSSDIIITIMWQNGLLLLTVTRWENGARNTAFPCAAT